MYNALPGWGELVGSFSLILLTEHCCRYMRCYVPRNDCQGLPCTAAPTLLKTLSFVALAMACTTESTALILLSGLVLVLSTYQIPRAASAEQVDFDTLLKNHEEALETVERATRRVLERGAWCKSAAACSGVTADDSSSPSNQCLIHACSGKFGNSFLCDDDFPRGASCPSAIRDSNKCRSERNATLVNKERPVVRIPFNSYQSTGDNKEIVIKDDFLDVRRDLCALKSIQSDFIEAHKGNNLTYWLYTATTNNVFMSIPAKADCRRGDTDNPLLACNKYQPNSRPWYVTAASGPRDIVFLLDQTSLTSDHTSRLNSALIEALNGIDFRDFIAVVAFDASSTTVLSMDGEDTLRNGETNFIKSLQEQIHNLPRIQAQYPNIMMAFEKAFDLLEHGAENEMSSKCSKYIVLLTGNEDACFQECVPGKTCKCVGNIQGAIKKRQQGSGATIVTFSENVEATKQNNIERLAKTIACDPEASGIWRRVSSDDDNRAAFSTFNEIVAFSMFQESPMVFSSQLYKDFSGLGDVFTLAKPIYEVDAQRLVAVVGADLTLSKVSEAIGSESEAREEIRKLSSASRKCAKPKERNGCALQALRSTAQSALCANVLPSKTGESDISCYRFGDDEYRVIDEEMKYDDAVAKCEDDLGGHLAIVDTKEKNEFLAGLFNVDGSWIGMKAEQGGKLTWVDEKDVSEEQRAFGFGDIEKAQMQILNNLNRDRACVTADRRGVKENWNVIQCDELRPFICEVGSINEGVLSISPCVRTFDPSTDENPFENDNPILSSCAQSSISSENSCSDEENKATEKVNPLCNETGRDYSDFDRMACGGRADSSGETKCSNALEWWKILLIALGVVVAVGLLVCAALFLWKCTRRDADPAGHQTYSNSEHLGDEHLGDVSPESPTPSERPIEPESESQLDPVMKFDNIFPSDTRFEA